VTSPLTDQQLDDIDRSVAAHFHHDEKPEARAARWEAAALAAGREVDRNALAVYLAVADAEQRALADSWARAMAATDAEIRRLRAELATARQHIAAQVVEWSSQQIGVHVPTVDAIADMLRAQPAAEETHVVAAFDPQASEIAMRGWTA